MINNIKGMLLFIALLIVCVGIASAADADNITDTTIIDSQEMTQTHDSTGITTDTQSDSDNSNNNIQKQLDEKTVKTKATGNKITINPVKEFHAGNSTIISGSIKDSNGNPIDTAKLFIEFKKEENGKYDPFSSKTFTSYDDGTFEYYFKTDQGGKYQVTVSDYYDFEQGVLGTSATRNFTVLGKVTTLTIYKIADTQYSDNLVISGYLYTSGYNYLAGKTININVNGEQVTEHTGSSGYYSYTYKANTVGVNNVTVSYPGSTDYYKVSQKATFNVTKKPTRITLNDIETVAYTDNVTITGKYADSKGISLKNMPLTVTINDDTYNTVTDNSGLFTFSCKTNKTKTNEVLVSSKENDKYQKDWAKKTFWVTKKESKLTIDPIKDTQYTDNATITGQLTDIDGNIIASCPLTMTINKENTKYTTTTDKNGKFKYTLMTYKILTNTILISSTGDDRYAKSTTEKTFTVTPQTTKITINKIEDTQYSDKVTITGQLTDKNNVALSHMYLYVDINGKSVKIETDNEGMFKHTRTTNKTGTNALIITFKKTSKYLQSTAKKTFKVIPKESAITINNIETTRYTDNVTISGKFTDSGNVAIANAKVTLEVNGMHRTVKTDTKGLFKFTLKTNKLGKNTVTISFNGSSKYAKTSATKTFKVTRQLTRISLNKIAKTQYTDNVTVKGTFTDKNGKALKSKVTIKHNGLEKTVETNSKGVFKFTTKASKAGSNTLTVSYGGSDYYAKTLNKTTFTVTPKTTKITINKIKKTTYNSNVSISGKLTDTNGNVLKNTKVVMKINGVPKTLKTNSKGVFSYSKKTTKAGSNTVTVSYSGSDKYQSVTASKTFTVDKLASKITVNKISNTQFTDNATIKGKVTDKNGKVLKNAKVTVNVNGALYTTTTNKKGVYSIKYRATWVGTNSVTVSYAGDDNLKASKTSATFKVVPVNTIMVVLAEDANYSEYTLIKGYLVDKNWNNLRNTGITLNINGKTYNCRTDDYGDFKYSFKTDKAGANTVTASFAGTEKYAYSTDKANFNVYKKDTVLLLDELYDPIQGDSILISGRLTDNGGNALRYTPVTINVRGSNYNVQTDDEGYYYYFFDTKVVGTHNVIVSYSGNQNYNPDNSTDSFNVIKSGLVVGDTIQYGSKDFSHYKCGGHIIYDGMEGHCNKCGAIFYGDYVVG